jgi:hypothetical protein
MRRRDGIVGTIAVFGCGLLTLGAVGCAQHGHPEPALPGPPAQASGEPVAAPAAASSQTSERRASVPWYDDVRPRPLEWLQPRRDAGASPFEGLRSDDPRKRVLQFLMETGHFVATGVGIGGDPPAQAGAFGIILLDQPEAAEAFGAVVDRGDVAGQLYGLCGLYLKDGAAFDRRIGAFRTREGVIQEWSGCTSRRVAVKALVERIAAGGPTEALAHMAIEIRTEAKENAGPATKPGE